MEVEVHEPVTRTRREGVGVRVVGGLVTVWALAGVWTEAWTSVTLLGESREMRVCPAIYPAPPTCTPELQVGVAAVASVLILAAAVWVFWEARALERALGRVPVLRGRAGLALGLLLVVGAVGWLATTRPPWGITLL